MAVLANVLFVSVAEKFSGVFGDFGVECQGIKFVIAHDREGRPFFDHGPHDFKYLTNFRTPVDEIAEENHITLGMP